MIDYLDNHCNITKVNINRKRKFDLPETNNNNLSDNIMLHSYTTGNKKRKATDEIVEFNFPDTFRNMGAVDLSSTFHGPLKTVGGPAKYVTQTVIKNNSNNNRSTAGDGDYQIVVGENLNSMAQMYEVLAFLGRGTFGQVVKCRCRANNRMVAIKILKNHPSYMRQGNVEIQILQTLSQEDTESYNIVKAIECFQHKNHMCLVFELLEQNLYEYLKMNKFRPMTLPEIRPIAQQVLSALSKLRQLQLIHADLKPENIMLVNPASGVMRYRVKVIDFGSACVTTKAVQNTYLQSRYYRAPEILLGLPFSEAIDMWSLGCVVAELFLGWPLYPGSSEYDQIRYIVETQGLPPNEMLKNAVKVNRFFLRDSYEWRLKRQEEYLNETGQRTKEARKYVFTHLDQIRNVSPRPECHELDYEVEMEDRKQFASLLIQMLQMRPEDRITPDTALNHSLITMNTLQKYMFNKRVRDSLALMQVCYRNGNRLTAIPNLVDTTNHNIPKLIHGNSGILTCDQSNRASMDMINLNPDQYFLENLVSQNASMMISPNNLVRNNNGINHNRMLNPQMSLYELVAAGSNALSILAAASQPTAARDLLHQAITFQQQQQNVNNIRHDQSQAATAAAAAALVLSNQYHELNGMQAIYQKNPIYLPIYSNNYTPQNQMETYIPDPKFLTNSIPVQLMQNCGQTINWLEKLPINMSRHITNDSPFNPFINKNDPKELISSAYNPHNKISASISKNMAQNNNITQGQFIHDPYFQQTHQQAVASLIAGFDRPSINEFGFPNTSDIGSNKAANRSITALQQMLTSQNASFLNSMHSHQSQMAAALEAMQQQSQREINLANWNIPSSHSVCSGQSFLNEPLGFPNNPSSLNNCSTNNEISSYFSLLSKSNQESFNVTNTQNTNRSMLINPVLPNHLHNDLNQILPGLTALQSSENMLPLTSMNSSSILQDKFMIKISENNSLFHQIKSDNSLNNRFHLKKSSEILSIPHPFLDNINIGQIKNFQNTDKNQEYLPYSEINAMENFTSNCASGSSQLLDAMQYHLSSRNNSFTNVTSKPMLSANIKVSSIDQLSNEVIWPTESVNKVGQPLLAEKGCLKTKQAVSLTDNNHDNVHGSISTENISSTKNELRIKDFFTSLNDDDDETQNYSKFLVSASDDYTNNEEWQCDNNQQDNVDTFQFLDNNEIKVDTKQCQKTNSTQDTGGSKDKKNVPVGRVQPMIKEERQSISDTVSNNTSGFTNSLNSFDFSRIFNNNNTNNNSSTKNSTLTGLSGVNQIIVGRTSFHQTTAPSSNLSTSLSSQDNSYTHGNVYTSSKNDIRHLLVDHSSISSLSSSSFHHNHI